VLLASAFVKAPEPVKFLENLAKPFEMYGFMPRWKEKKLEEEAQKLIVAKRMAKTSTAPLRPSKPKMKPVKKAAKKPAKKKPAKPKPAKKAKKPAKKKPVKAKPQKKPSKTPAKKKKKRWGLF